MRKRGRKRGRKEKEREKDGERTSVSSNAGYAERGEHGKSSS